MSALARVAPGSVLRASGARRGLGTVSSHYGRSPAYRRIATRTGYLILLRASPLRFSFPSRTSAYRESISDLSAPSLPPFGRTFHSASSLLQQQEHSKEDIRDPPREEQTSSESQSSTRDESESTKGSSSQTNQEDGKQEKQEEGENEKEKKDAPPPPHGDKSPWQVFTETLKTEFQSSKEWNESTKALGGQVQEFTQNETLQRMRKGYGAASDAASSGTARALSGTGRVIGQSAAWTWDTAPVKGLRSGANAGGRVMEKMTRPLRETEAYKSVANVIDDGSSSRYGGWTESREERKAKRDAREMAEVKRTGKPRRTEKMEEDPEAGTNVTLHKDAAWKESWRNFRDSSGLFSRLDSMKNTYNESENPLISTARSISDRVAGFFAENETATVIKAFRGMDPNFQLEPFLQDMREYILPEVLDAYVKGDVEVLKLWLSEAQFQVYSALMRQYNTAGLKSDGRILDIRNVDVLSARMLEPNEIPVFILSARTQEVHVYRNAKSGDLAAGMEDKVQQVTYAIGLTRLPEEVNNPETRGWRLIELQKTSRDYV